MEHVLYSHKNCDSFITKKSTLFVFGHDVLIWQKNSMRCIHGEKRLLKKKEKKLSKLKKNTLQPPKVNIACKERQLQSVNHHSPEFEQWLSSLKKKLQHSLVITCFTHQNIKLSGERKTSFYFLLSINMYRCISPSTLPKKQKGGKEERKKGPIQIKTTEKKVEKEEQKCMCSRFSHRVFHHRHFG